MRQADYIVLNELFVCVCDKKVEKALCLIHAKLRHEVVLDYDYHYDDFDCRLTLSLGPPLALVPKENEDKKVQLTQLKFMPFALAFRIRPYQP